MKSRFRKKRVSWTLIKLLPENSKVDLCKDLKITSDKTIKSIVHMAEMKRSFKKLSFSKYQIRWCLVGLILEWRER